MKKYATELARLVYLKGFFLRKLFFEMLFSLKSYAKILSQYVKIIFQSKVFMIIIYEHLYRIKNLQYNLQNYKKYCYQWRSCFTKTYYIERLKY